MLNFIPRVAAAAVFLLVAGCASLPGGIQTNVSDFDGSREVYMEPAPLPTQGAMVTYILLGAHWTSEEPETVYLIARTTRDYTRIEAEDGLEFNIDGEVVSLDSDAALTELEGDRIQGVTHRQSTRPFTATLELVETLADSEGVRVRMRVGQGEYYEARLETEGMSAGAYNSLNEFLEEVKAQKAAMQED